MKLMIECYEVTVKFLIRKDYWHMQHKKAPNEKIIKEKIQEGGIEVPIEANNFNVEVA